jgi:sugar lactone lactonase YvrE
MMRRSFLLFAASFTLFLPSVCIAHGQGTRLWSQSKFDELERGRPDGVAITSDGHLVAGPSNTLLATTPSTYVWSVAADKDGNAYLATGSPATLLCVSPDGKTTKLFSSKDLTVQVVRVGPDGSVYAATLPLGKVYKFDPHASDLNEDNATVVFDPAATAEKPKYVWDMTFDAEGRLYIATGGPAGVYRIAPGSKPELFFKSDEQHIRTVAFDSAGNLIAGSDGSGLIYRIDKNGKGYVLYDAPKNEITSIAVAANGTIYAAAVGEKGRQTLPPLPVTGNASVTIKIVQPGSIGAFSANTLIPEGSDIYEIAPGGAPRKLWTRRDDIVYALLSTPQGLLAATGNRGRIYRIQEDGSYADIAHLEASQVTGLADSSRGTFLSTANTGKLYLLSHGDAGEGTYLSDVFDAGAFSQWGRAEVDANSATSSFDFYARAGNIENPERAWTDWKKVPPNVGPLGLDAARFVQWKAVLHPGADIASVGLNYLPVNAAPVVDEIVVEPGARVNSGAAEAVQEQQQVSINFPAQQNPGILAFSQEPGREPLVGLRDKSAVTVRWRAHDDNGDKLVYAVYYRGAGEHNWQLLKRNISHTYLSFNAELLPDGHYRLKVVASDAPSHNPGEALTGDKVSDGFVIDTTPPLLTGMAAQLANGKIHVEFTATDATTPISHAEYSVDAGPWQYVAPVGQLADSLTEKFNFDAPLPMPPPDLPAPIDAAEHVITVRAFDRNGNAVAVKAVVQ